MARFQASMLEMLRVSTVAALLLMSGCDGFRPSGQVYRPITPSKFRSVLTPKTAETTTTTSLRSTNNDASKDTERTSAAESVVNGVMSMTGGLINIDAARSTLASAFSALDESDQYDAVLTGLCAKILDSSSSGGQISTSIQDPINLLHEMNSRRIRASGRSMCALVDAAVAAQDARLMAQIVSLGSKNGAVNQYGKQQTEVTALPPNNDSKVRCSDGRTRTRLERIQELVDVPSDQRAAEITSALAVAGIVGFCGTVNVLGLDEISPFTNVVWFTIVTVGVVDNFYDLIKMGTKTFASSVSEKLPKNLPLSLGSGQVSGTVVKGFGRLLQVDTERECECEAAAFFAAYVLGLPNFAFRPNSLEAAVLVAESAQPDETQTLDSLLSNTGIMKMLIWLMAPVAMENSKHAQLIFSDPKEGQGLLKRLEGSNTINRDELWWMQDLTGQEKMDLLKWAYAEADILLRRNTPLVTEITKRLTSGSATVGDCIAAVEGW